MMKPGSQIGSWISMDMRKKRITSYHQLLDVFHFQKAVIEPSQVHVLSNSKSRCTRGKRLDEHPDAEWAKQTLTTGEFWNAEGEDWVVDGDVND
jgi:hypothetical protein